MLHADLSQIRRLCMIVVGWGGGRGEEVTGLRCDWSNPQHTISLILAGVCPSMCACFICSLEVGASSEAERLL